MLQRVTAIQMLVWSVNAIKVIKSASGWLVIIMAIFFLDAIKVTADFSMFI